MNKRETLRFQGYFRTLEDKQDAQAKAKKNGLSLAAWLLKNAGYEVNKPGGKVGNKGGRPKKYK